MKKSILIFCAVLTSFSLMGFGYMNWSNTVTNHDETSCNKKVVFGNDLVNTSNKQAAIDFFYDVDSRFILTITKEELQKVKSITDIFSKEQAESIVSYKSVSVIIIEDNKQTDIRESGTSDVLNAAQIKLLRSAPYSTNFLIRADYVQKNKETGELEDNYTTPHITIVPEKQAVYISGKDALIEYLKENSKEKVAIVKEDKLQPGKIYFTVTTKGTISNIKLQRTSGYPSIDETMIELITKMPGKWEPATNSKGEEVDQILVFSFGTAGC